MRITRRAFTRQWLPLALTVCSLAVGAAGVKEPTLQIKKKVTGPPPVISDGPNGPLAVEKLKLNLKSNSPSEITELTPDPLTTLLVLASLDGTLTAVDRFSGDLRWVSKDEPMIKVPSGPTSAKAPYFLPDPKTGSLYVMGRKNSLRKLPFTIPQLVAMAPCKNSEGLMYTGRKLDYWLKLNPHTGEKSEVPLYGESCPAKLDPDDDINESCTASETVLSGMRKSLLIGKTEYTLSMADGPRKWNVTYHHYSSADMNAQSTQDYDLVHFTSPSTGSVLTYDRESGQLLWQRELDSPIIAVYNVDYVTSNLVSVPFNPIAPETLTRLKTVSTQNNKPLSPTTYIGESNYGLYAVPALVDEMVLLMSGDGTTQYPPLIEGPAPGQSKKPTDSNGTPIRIVDSAKTKTSQQQINESIENPNTDFIILGYYNNPPEPPKPVMQIDSGGAGTSNSKPTSPSETVGIGAGASTIGDSLPPGHYNDSHQNQHQDAESISVPTRPETVGYPKDKLEILGTVPLSQAPVTPNKVQFPPFPLLPQVSPAAGPSEGQVKKEVKPIKIVFTTAAISVLATVTVILGGTVVYRRYYLTNDTTSKNANENAKDKEKTSDTEEDTMRVPITKPRKSADGSTVSVGKISFAPSSVLGKGCEGTFVFKGKFEDRDVAVKRILPECFAFADREVDLLKESDQHPNVIRYFCTESDGQFRYIALELCEATVSDWIEGKFQCEQLDKDPIQILREATDGLAHLHSLRIVHRDIKPANVLISVNAGGRVRTMISDFGLCKKITNGRMSFSRRSGGIPGTDGWIAPEVLKNMNMNSVGVDKSSQSHRMSYSVDVFSLGCVYYFVLTKGDHPFGEPFRRQSNIINGDYKLEKLSSQSHPQSVGVGVIDLISLMISSEPSARPPLSAVLCHPIFWSKEKILTFFLDVSDRIEKEEESRCLLLRRLESDGPRIVRDDWRDHICAEVAMDLRKYRTYKGQSVRDLLRALRNKKNHYRELTPEAQASLGHIPEEFVDYWVNRFPLLLPYTWLKFESVRDEPIFTKYYPHPKDFSFNLWINGEDDELLEEDLDEDKDRLGVRGISPGPGGSDRSPKLDKNFWRSKSQFKYNKWRRQQQNTGLKDSPHNFTSFATQKYPTQNQGFANTNTSSPDTDSSWRNPVPKS